MVLYMHIICFLPNLPPNSFSIKNTSSLLLKNSRTTKYFFLCIIQLIKICPQTVRYSLVFQNSSPAFFFFLKPQFAAKLFCTLLRLSGSSCIFLAHPLTSPWYLVFQDLAFIMVLCFYICRILDKFVKLFFFFLHPNRSFPSLSPPLPSSISPLLTSMYSSSSISIQKRAALPWISTTTKNGLSTFSWMPGSGVSHL